MSCNAAFCQKLLTIYCFYQPSELGKLIREALQANFQTPLSCLHFIQLKQQQYVLLTMHNFCTVMLAE